MEAGGTIFKDPTLGVPHMAAHYMTNMQIDLNWWENFRPHAPDEIIQTAEVLATDMGDLVELWARLIKMVSRLKEDAGRLAAGSPGFHDRVMATLEHVINDLDFRDKTVSWYNLTPN